MYLITIVQFYKSFLFFFYIEEKGVPLVSTSLPCPYTSTNVSLSFLVFFVLLLAAFDVNLSLNLFLVRLITEILFKLLWLPGL